MEQPAFGQVRIANEVRQRGHSTSPVDVRGVWQRGDLEMMKKRLKALEAKVARGRNHPHREPARCAGKGGMASSRAGPAIAVQDTFYVGNMKGVGRIYQQTFIDTYSKIAFPKLYDRKTRITAAGPTSSRCASSNRPSGLFPTFGTLVFERR